MNIGGNAKNKGRIFRNGREGRMLNVELSLRDVELKNWELIKNMTCGWQGKDKNLHFYSVLS